jgi:hypothetical protein
MTSPRPRNIAASVHQRLLAKAKDSARPFNELFQYYAIEHFLYRLSRSSHAGKFILKGALMFQVWDSRASRSTMDIDMLGKMKDNPEVVIAIVWEICRQKVEPDGVVFDPESVRGERITEGADYEGVRIRFRGSLDTARIAIQLDVGFGDHVFLRRYGCLTRRFWTFLRPGSEGTVERVRLPRSSRRWSDTAP